MRVRGFFYGIAAAAVLAASVIAEAPGGTDGIADWAKPVGTLPTQIDGSTSSARIRTGAPDPSCSPGQGVVWYQATAPRRGPMLAAVKAGGDSDAALVVYKLVRSKATEISCSLTDNTGTASVPWYAYPGRSYLIGVARRSQSPTGSFTLSVTSREPLPQAPGSPLPASGVSDTVTPFVDAADAWAVPMTRGVSYKVNLASPRGCVRLDIYKPGTYRFLETRHADGGRLSCGGYLLFTPGVDGGGTYSILVSAAGTRTAPQPYRLMVSQAGTDDTAPGVELVSGATVTGSLDSASLDVTDLYSFVVPYDGSLTTIDFRPAASLRYDLLVVDESGGRKAAVTSAHGRRSLQENISPGRYFLFVRALHQTSGGYRLSVLTREVTSTTLSANGTRYAQSTEGASVSLGVYVTSVSHGGAVEIEIDRNDPIYGWQFSSVLTGSVSSSGRFTTSWTPPWAGHWRLRARFPGNVYSTPSASGYAFVHVRVPLGL